MSLPKANKKLGQHFLKNPQVIESITQSHPSMDFDFILEIGPGPAILSKKLIAHNKKYIAVEKDQRFIIQPTMKAFDELLEDKEIFIQCEYLIRMAGQELKS